MGVRENECQISQELWKNRKIRKISCVRCNFGKFDIHFLRLQKEIFFGVTTDDLLHLKPMKNVAKNAICFK